MIKPIKLLRVLIALRGCIQGGDGLAPFSESARKIWNALTRQRLDAWPTRRPGRVASKRLGEERGRHLVFDATSRLPIARTSLRTPKPV